MTAGFNGVLSGMNNTLDPIALATIALILRSTDRNAALDLVDLANKLLAMDGIKTRISKSGSLLDVKLDAGAVARTFQPVTLKY